MAEKYLFTGMKISSVKLILIGVLIGCAVLVIRNQNAIAKLTALNRTLSVAAAEVEHVERENRLMPRFSGVDEEVLKLRRDNRELPKLRNEIYQLRERAKELKSLTAENKRLQMLKKHSADLADSVVSSADFILRSSLRDVGLASPEAALQTSFWAMCQGDLIRWSQSKVDGEGYLQLDKEHQEWQRKRLVEDMEHFVGFRIAHKKVISATEVELGLQSSSAGAVFPVILKLIGSEWKVD